MKRNTPPRIDELTSMLLDQNDIYAEKLEKQQRKHRNDDAKKIQSNKENKKVNKWLNF